MLEIGECMELQAKSSELTESADADFSDISFEELLAQEKKDSFWLVSSVESYVYSLSLATFGGKLYVPCAGRKMGNLERAPVDDDEVFLANSTRGFH